MNAVLGAFVVTTVSGDHVSVIDLSVYNEGQLFNGGDPIIFHFAFDEADVQEYLDSVRLAQFIGTEKDLPSLVESLLRVNMGVNYDGDGGDMLTYAIFRSFIGESAEIDNGLLERFFETAREDGVIGEADQDLIRRYLDLYNSCYALEERITR